MLFFIVYHFPLWLPILISAVAVIVWPNSMAKLNRKSTIATKWLNIVLTAIALFGIATITVLNRSHFNNEVILMPFHSFIEAKGQKEIYRSMLMNVFLFVPLGIFMPYILPKRKINPIVFTILFALVLSIGIETYQLVFSRGRCETDDVICNTLGAIIGSLTYLIFIRKTKKE